MLEWISEHSETISAVSNVAMLFVWIAYLQVFLSSYRRQVRPKIIVNRAAGSALNAACFVGNMSSESIYIESIIVRLCGHNRDISRTVTDVDEIGNDEQAGDPRQRTLQGPLRPGDYTSIGTFDELIEKVHRNKGEGADHPTTAREPISLEIMVVADYSSDNLLIGAKRTFTVEPQGQNWLVTPKTAETQQIRSRRERHKIKHLLQE